MPSASFTVVRNGVEMAYAPPKKRRQLEAADAKHLALWANDPELPPSARKRAQGERERRKRLSTGCTVGVLEDVGGATPEQVAQVAALLEAWHPSLILHPFSSGSLHHVCERAANVQIVHEHQAGRDAHRVIGLPNATRMPDRKTEGVWRELRHAKDRGADVTVIWPDGSTLTGRW
jgi:hypothetical protein